MIEIKYHSGIYQLKSEQVIQASLDQVWDYFSKPQNLNNLTPDDMKFKITSGEPAKMYEGQIITYRIEIFTGVKNNWVTEIKTVKDKEMFIDEQRFGPYQMWHHEHHFKAIGENKVQMNDIVSYKLPIGMAGRLVAGKMIKNRVKNIFEFREIEIDKIFE